MMRLMWTAVNRTTRTGKVLGEAQRVSPIEALRAMTIDAAYAYHEEDSKGSIEVGKRADFVILERNPLTVPTDDIKDIKIVQTIKDGKTTYARQ
jgi:predicted amidohydrolase YtcJ